jgi:hypothetical protein
MQTPAADCENRHTNTAVGVKCPPLKRAAKLPLVQPFLAALSARFSFKVFSGFFFVSFFLSKLLAMTLSPCNTSLITDQRNQAYREFVEMSLGLVTFFMPAQ